MRSPAAPTPASSSSAPPSPAHARLSGGLIAIEGEHLLDEALRSGLALKTVFLSERATAPD